MNDPNMMQLALTLVALPLVMAPLVLLAFVAGRRSGSKTRIDELERLRPEVMLDGTSWRAGFDGDEASSPRQTFIVQWQQIGSRIIAESTFPDGTRLSLEGVLHHRQLCCVARDRSRRDDGLGAVLVEIRPGDREMVGMRARWSPQSQTLLLRKAVFICLDGDVS